MNATLIRIKSVRSRIVNPESRLACYLWLCRLSTPMADDLGMPVIFALCSNDYSMRFYLMDAVGTKYDPYLFLCSIDQITRDCETELEKSILYIKFIQNLYIYIYYIHYSLNLTFSSNVYIFFNQRKESCFEFRQDKYIICTMNYLNHVLSMQRNRFVIKISLIK